MNKNELVEKLNLISQRYKDVCAIRERINNVVPNDSYQRNVVLPDFPEVNGDKSSALLLKNTVEHKGEGALEGAKLAYESVCPLPKKPQEPKKLELKKPDKPRIIKTLTGVFGTTLAISIFCLFCGISIIGSQWGNILTIMSIVGALLSLVGLVATFITGLVVIKIKERVAKSKLESDQNAQAEKYNEEVSKYQLELNEYRQREQAFLNEYLSWRGAYLEHLAEEERISAQLEIDKKAIIKEIEEGELILALDKLNEVNDLVGEDYLPSINTITSLIKNGRADSLKEAINLYEELLYKERQLQLEREKEDRRRYEEQMRRQDEERRHEEQMRFLEEQEYQRQREEASRRYDEERRYREEENRRQAEDERRQAESRREESRRQHEERVSMYREHRNTQRQCNSCALNGRCTMAFRRSNCASYQPK